MPTLTTGAIKSMRVPEQYSDHSQKRGGLGANNWSHTYRHHNRAYPEISVRYTGFPLLPEVAACFRELLLQEPHIVFAEGDPQHEGEASKELVRRISHAMGNSGDNQIANTATGLDGPMFHLQKMEICGIGQRSVLRVKGFFHNPQLEPKVYLDCLFIDENQQAKDCFLEELYFQAFPEDLFKSHEPDFQHVLDTLTWSN